MKTLNQQQCEEILVQEGLEHLIGNVRFSFGENNGKPELRVFPLDTYADRWVGAGEYLGFEI